MLIGRGFAAAWDERVGDVRDAAAGRLVAFVLAQGYGVVALHPFGLSYYNLLVGGLPGAERLGLELTYWGDAVDRVLLDRLAGAAAPATPGRPGADALSRAGDHDHHPSPAPPRRSSSRTKPPRPRRRLGGRLAPDRLLEPRARSGSPRGPVPDRHPIAPGGLALGSLGLPDIESSALRTSTTARLLHFPRNFNLTSGQPGDNL